MPLPYRYYQGVPITPQEYEAATSSIWYNPNNLADGRSNLTPEGNIAVVRGARYDSNGPLFFSDMVITDQAMRDLACYLGFRNVNDYNSALLTEGSGVFNRTHPPIIPATATYPFPVIVQNGDKQILSDKQKGDPETSAKSGRRAHGKPSIFDTGYFYEGELTPGASDDFGSFLGSFDYPGSEENP